MENNENFVEQTENVEQTTEESAQTSEKTSEKTFTQDDVDRLVKEKLDEVIPGKIARTKAKIEKEYQKKYGSLEQVLKAGTGKESVEEITDAFRGFYQGKGIKIPQASAYSDKDMKTLASADAQEIIQAGYEEVVEEVERLAALGVENMSAREKATFKTLAEHRKYTEQVKALSQIGVTEQVYGSREFQEFAGKFNPNTPVTDIYDIYTKSTQPKKEITTMGSMKSNVPDTGVKDYYSFEEASKFTKKDFDNNPALYQKVLESMTKWK